MSTTIELLLLDVVLLFVVSWYSTTSTTVVQLRLPRVLFPTGYDFWSEATIDALAFATVSE
jgi:hypothetical protein